MNKPKPKPYKVTHVTAPADAVERVSAMAARLAAAQDVRMTVRRVDASPSWARQVLGLIMDGTSHSI